MFVYVVGEKRGERETDFPLITLILVVVRYTLPKQKHVFSPNLIGEL